MKEPKYKVGDWVKLHAITPKGAEMTYHVTNIRIEICEGGTQIFYRMSEHHRDSGMTGRGIDLPEMKINTSIGSTIK